ncbi:TPA: DegT/DnrJ/EryC1/StrS aminotransferase family protein [Pseudomonas aeruginosa]|nr:DegT/DnrJ/EryC1/StrS aminotransferase family protein [Pseudomonas aeruginosa]
MLNTPFSPWPSFSEEEANAVRDVVLSNRVNYWTGQECREFEKEFATWADSRFAVALANGTVALDVALKALGIGVGDKAIICVHLAGWPCDMDPIMALAEEHGLKVVEDCAQAHGARYKGRSVGSIGHISAWSFCQDKIMTTGGEGGMVTTDDRELWSRMWSYKDHGKSWEAVYEREHAPGFRWLHESFGTNFRMMEVQAVIGRIQLRRMGDWHVRRLANAQRIWEKARNLPGLRVPIIPEGIEHAAYKCYVFVDPPRLAEGWTRDRILSEIVARGVPCFSGSCSEIYLEKAFDSTGWRPEVRLPNAVTLGEDSLMFLVHPTLSESEIQRTLDVLEAVMLEACRDSQVAGASIG